VRKPIVALIGFAVLGGGAFYAWRRQESERTERRPATSVERVARAAERFRTPSDRGARATDPRRAEALALLGRGQYERSLSVLRTMQRDRPQDLEPIFFEALAHKEMKSYAQARLAIERVLDGIPEFQKPWTSLYYYGWILLNTGDAEGARAAFTTFLEFDPKQGDAYFGLGLLDMERLDLDAAEANFRKAMAQAEAELRAGKRSSGADLAKSTARLGEVMFERERYEAARDFLREALALAPDSYEAWYLLHRVYKKLGDSAGAAEALARHEATKPADASTNP
jgi:tetratricopeptide (TPR) repeat protein